MNVLLAGGAAITTTQTGVGVAGAIVVIVSDKDHARAMLSTADSHEQVVAIMGQLKKEMDAAGRAPGIVKKEIREGFTKDNAGSTKPANAPKYQEGQTATGPNGAKMVFKGGKWQPLQ